MTTKTPELATRKLTLRKGTVDEEKRTVDAVISTSAFVRVYHPERGAIVTEAIAPRAFDPLPEQIPLFAEHAQGMFWQLGSARNLRYEENQLVATIHYNTENSTDAERAWALVRNGDAIHYSIGYIPRAMTELKAGEEMEINGQNFRAEVDSYITTNAELNEVSLVGIPADKGAKARSQTQEGGTTMPENTHEAPKTAPPVAPETSQRSEPTTPPINEAEIIQRGIQREHERQVAIRKLAGEDTSPEIVEKALSDTSITAERAAQMFLEDVRAKRAAAVPSGAPNVNTGRGADELSTTGVLRAGLLHQLGHSGAIVPRNASESAKRQAEREANEGYKFAQLSMLDLCREVNRAKLGSGAPISRDEVIRTAVSGGDLGKIFTSSMNAVLMLNYAEQPSSIDGWTQPVDVADFKTNEYIGVSPVDGLRPLPRGKASTHATMDDVEEPWKINRYGNQFVIDEQDIIDDNLNVFGDQAMRHAMAAARLAPDLVYSELRANAALSDGEDLFSSAHANTDTTALDEAAIGVGRAKMLKQTYNGVNLNINPRFLIVTTELDFTARRLLNSTQLIAAGDSDVLQGDRNVVADLGLQLRTDSRLSNGVTNPLTGVRHNGSATAWYLAAAPTEARTIVVGYLRGTGRGPTLRSWTIDRDGQYGIGFDVKMDVGVKALDFRGLYRGNS